MEELGRDITDEMGQIVSKRKIDDSELELQTQRYNQGGGTTGAPREVRNYEKKPSWAGRFNPTKKHKEWRPEDPAEPVEEEEEEAPPQQTTEAEDKLHGNYDEWVISDDEEEPTEGEDVVQAVEEITIKPSSLDMNWEDAVNTQLTKTKPEGKTMMDFMPKEGFEGPTPFHETPMRELTRAETRAGERWQAYAEKEGFEYRAGATKNWKEYEPDKEKKIAKLQSAGGASMEGWNLHAGEAHRAVPPPKRGSDVVGHPLGTLEEDRERARYAIKRGEHIAPHGIHSRKDERGQFKTPFPAYKEDTEKWKAKYDSKPLPFGDAPPMPRVIEANPYPRAPPKPFKKKKK